MHRSLKLGDYYNCYSVGKCTINWALSLLVSPCNLVTIRFPETSASETSGQRRQMAGSNSGQAVLVKSTVSRRYKANGEWWVELGAR